MLESTKEAISYLYFRFLLVTELYMVEPWERGLMLVISILYLAVLSLFNNRVLLRIVAALLNNSPNEGYQDGGFLPKSFEQSEL